MISFRAHPDTWDPNIYFPIDFKELLQMKNLGHFV